MKAMTYTQYGSPDNLLLTDIQEPTPNEDEVLVEVHASSVNYGTLALVQGKPFVARIMGGGIFRPAYPTPGNDIAGRVADVGSNVTRFKPGDRVYGDTADIGFGAYTESVAVPESVLAHMPENLSFTQAAAVPEAGLVALQALRDFAPVQPGQHVLIAGASGGIGTFAVQIASALGAEVTAVCGARNADLMRSLGADHVIDYAREDFAENEGAYDLIVATMGDRPLDAYRKTLKKGGTHVATGGELRQIFEPLLLGWLHQSGDKHMHSLMLKTNKDLDVLTEMIEAEQVSPVVDRCFPFEEIPAALKYYGERHATGKIVIDYGRGGA